MLNYLQLDTIDTHRRINSFVKENMYSLPFNIVSTLSTYMKTALYFYEKYFLKDVGDR